MKEGVPHGSHAAPLFLWAGRPVQLSSLQPIFEAFSDAK
jgi:hypothetical protein